MILLGWQRQQSKAVRSKRQREDKNAAFRMNQSSQAAEVFHIDRVDFVRATCALLGQCHANRLLEKIK